MQAFQITLTSVADVRQFVDAATRYSCDVDVISGRYTVNGKSIIGLLSLDLAAPIRAEFYGTDEEAAAFGAAIAPFIAKD